MSPVERSRAWDVPHLARIARITRRMERLFLAVPLTDAARVEIQDGLRSVLAGSDLPGRAVHPDNWHLTLRFLGDTEEEHRIRLVEELPGVDLGPGFMLEFGGLGAFPRPDRARVLWLGVEHGAAELSRLAATVEQAVRRGGYPAEEKPFRAHLTLSRIQPPRSVAALVAGGARLDVRMPVDRVVLFRSHLGRGRPRYEEVAYFPLAEGSSS